MYEMMMGEDSVSQRYVLDSLDKLEDSMFALSEEWTENLGVEVELDFMREPHRTYTGYLGTRLVENDGVYALKVFVDGFTVTGFESTEAIERFLEDNYGTGVSR